MKSSANLDIMLDSAEVKNGEFVFWYKPAKKLQPFAAILVYADSSGKSRSLAFINHHTSTKEKILAVAAFWLEPGTTVITGDFNNEFHKIEINAGPDNDLFYRYTSGFGYLPENDTKRAEHISFYQSEIKKHPKSNYLLECIYDQRERYTTEELKTYLTLFDKEIVDQNSFSRSLTQYITYLTKPGDNYPNLQLPDAKGNMSAIMNGDAKLNMLVFWASWCGPCRMEIPALKAVQQQFGQQGLHMASISIDENLQAWQKALAQENMPWAQYVMDADNADKYKAQYRISSVPQVVFTDAAGKELLRVNGYDLNEPNPYIPFIAAYLKNAGK